MTVQALDLLTNEITGYVLAVVQAGALKYKGNESDLVDKAPDAKVMKKSEAIVSIIDMCSGNSELWKVARLLPVHRQYGIIYQIAQPNL